MKIAIIADDLTGANDSGVQFARSGLATSVLLQMQNDTLPDDDVIIMDTDSRSVSPEEAYLKVKAASEYVVNKPFDIIFKKIDSTLRGNIGAELDALHDVFQPDFIVCTPAYPDYNRVVRNGTLYLGDKLLHETEFALDPKTPMKQSFIPSLIKEQSTRLIGLLTLDDLALGDEHLLGKLREFHEGGQCYIVCDAVKDKDLQQIVTFFSQSKYRIVWSGSAGLANCLTSPVGSGQIAITRSEYPILIVVGSVNKNTRKQLSLLLAEPDVKGIKMLAHHVVAGDVLLEEEVARVFAEATAAIAEGMHIALYSSGEQHEVKLANKAGEQIGLSPTAVSDKISEVLGQTAAQLLLDNPINRLILTGGDTAKQFCRFAHMEKFKLIDEVESGVPVGIFSGEKEIYGVTKAGGFGSDDVLIASIKVLQGEREECSCVQ